LRLNRRLAAVIVAMGVLFVISAQFAVRGPEETSPRVERVESRTLPSFPDPNREVPLKGIRVATFNVAHGRGTSFHQTFVGSGRIRSNLSRIGAVLAQNGVDLAAIQEIDGPSMWSGAVDQARVLALASGLSYFVRGSHVRGIGMDHGTAILSRWPLDHAISRTFPISIPTLPKGFVVASLRWPGKDRLVDLVSVHLDFLRGSVRRKQFVELAAYLGTRARPVLVMGDLNCEWSELGTTLDHVAASLGLQAYAPESKEMETFPNLGRRIDWILASSEIEILSYEVMPEVLSDHLGIVATILLHVENS